MQNTLEERTVEQISDKCRSPRVDSIVKLQEPGIYTFVINMTDKD